MVTKNHENISSRELRKMLENFVHFEIQEIQELKQNSENQNTTKSASTWLYSWTSWAEN